MTDYWKDRRPPAERLPDCERLLEEAGEKTEWMREEVERLQNAQIRILKTSTEAMRRSSAEARLARQERDLCINQACTALKPLALLAVPPEGPIAHLNTGEEVTMDDIERAVRFVSRWRGLMDAEVSHE